MKPLDESGKPEEVDDNTWRQHLDWMRVMESSRQRTRPLQDLMDSYFVPAGSGSNRRKSAGKKDRGQ